MLLKKDNKLLFVYGEEFILSRIISSLTLDSNEKNNLISKLIVREYSILLKKINQKDDK
jgi:hypothetical protein